MIETGFTFGRCYQELELIIRLPVFAWYSKRYYDLNMDGYFAGWHVRYVVLRVRASTCAEPLGKQKELELL